MSTEARLSPDDLDELVPPPGPRWRPVLLVVVVFAAGMWLSAAWAAGRITPMVNEEWGWSYGGRDWVYLSASVSARGADIELVDIWEPPPGLALRAVRVERADEPAGPDIVDLDSWRGVDLPAQLSSGETTQITAVYDVVDCDQLHTDDLTIEVLRQWGPFSLQRSRDLEQQRVGFSVEREVPRDLVGPGTSDPLFVNVQVGWAEGIAFAVCPAKPYALP